MSERMSKIKQFPPVTLKSTPEFNHLPWVHMVKIPASVVSNPFPLRSLSNPAIYNPIHPHLMRAAQQPYFEHNYAKQLRFNTNYQLDQDQSGCPEKPGFRDPLSAETIAAHQGGYILEFFRANRPLLSQKKLAKRAKSIKKLRESAEMEERKLAVFMNKTEANDGTQSNNNRRTFSPRVISQEIPETSGLNEQQPTGLMHEPRPTVIQGSIGYKMSNLRNIQKNLSNNVRSDLAAIDQLLSEEPNEELPYVERFLQTSHVLAKSIREILQELKGRMEVREGIAARKRQRLDNNRNN